MTGAVPGDPSKAAGFAKKEQEVIAIVNKIEDWKKDFQTIVANFADNRAKTQGPIALVAAVKSARRKAFDEKRIRVKAGLAVKGALVVLGVAAGIAAIVLSAGAATPLVVGLAVAGLALSGISSLGALAKSVADNVNTEKKLLANVTNEVKAIEAAFGAVSQACGKLGKHVTELQNLIKIREDAVSELENDVKPLPGRAQELPRRAERPDPPQGRRSCQREGSQGEGEGRARGRHETRCHVYADGRAEGGQPGRARAAQESGGSRLADRQDLRRVEPNTALGKLTARYKGLDGFLTLSGELVSVASSASTFA
jgi:HAMP domain-containing protein